MAALDQALVTLDRDAREALLIKATDIAFATTLWCRCTTSSTSRR